MSDYDHRNQAFDYAPPTRGGSGSGALMFIGGILVLFVLAIIFMGGGTGPVPEGDAAAPAVEQTAPSAPVAPAPVD
jgi:hypothetical protein